VDYHKGFVAVKSVIGNLGMPTYHTLTMHLMRRSRKEVTQIKRTKKLWNVN
jgi:hypothetical protein